MKSTFSKIALAVLFFGLSWSCKPELNPSVAVESVTLNKQILELVVGQRDSLIATVLPENASDKSVVWTSSAESVVTVTNGALNALSLGEATITVTTVDGKKTANCVVTVLSEPQPGSLDGVFSVAAGKKIRFSKGNLRYSLTDSSWGFYPEQYIYGPAIYTEGHNAEISLFTWGYGDWSVTPDTKSHSTAYAEEGASLANSDDWGAVLAETGSWRTLTSAEWNYILVERDGAANKCKYGVTVCGNANCLVIAPDNFAGTIEASYTQETWAAAEQNDKLVCLPAAGLRNGDVTVSVGESGHYWTASSAGDNKAFSIDTQSAPVKTAGDSKLAPRSDHRDLAPASSSSNTSSADESVTIDMGRNPVAKLSNASRNTGNFKRGAQPVSASNGNQQGTQNEPLIPFSKKTKANHKSSLKSAPARTASANTPRTAGETINVTATIWQYNDFYYDVYLANENTTYVFELLGSTGGLTYGKTYTYADMYADWVCTLDEEGYPLVKATDATLTVTKDQDGLIHVAATMVLNGDNHIITYDEKPFEPSGVQIPLNGTDLSGSYNSWYYMYVYTAKVGNNTVQLAFNATEEQATYTKDQILTDYCVYYSPDYSTYVEFVKAASDFTVTNTEKTKTLTGSLYADNGDEYIINLVYEKPDAKQINISMKDADLTNRITAGYWVISGQTDDKVYSFNIYFKSKALQGTWTDVEQFYSYNTWVSDKSSGTNVNYENLSEVNLTTTVVKDSLKVTGTMNLADSKGNPAIVNIHASTHFEQAWGEWADFAPFDKNTGKYNFATLGTYTQVGIQVQERKDNTGLKQYTLKNWGKGYYDGVGQDLILNMNPDYTFTFVSNPVNLGAEVILADVATAYNNPAYASFNSYNPETGVFDFYTAVVFANSGQIYTVAEESLVMDKPITERDTVKVTADMKVAPEPANGIIKVSAESDETTYILEVVGDNPIGTFSLAYGTLSQKYYYGIVSATGRSDFAEGEVTIAENGTGLKLDGLMIGEDEKAYVLDWTYTPITERDTLKFSGRGVTISECVSSQTGRQTGWFYDLTDASTGYEFLLQSTVIAEKYGTFSYADGTLGNNYYNVFDPEGNRQQFVEGSITVGVVGDELVFDGELIAEDEKAYVLHFTQPASVLTYDTNAPFDAAYAYNEMSASIENGVISIVAVNAEKQKISLELYADPANTTIPAGTYAISDTQEAGTALKSVGVDKDNMLAQCWAGTIDKDGYISDCWFLTEGNVVVSYDQYGKLHVEVDAKNSWGQTVTAEVSYEHVAVDPLLRENGYSVRLVSDLE